jgi:hypothetical protein
MRRTAFGALEERCPLSHEELARKFHDNAVRSLPEERAAEIAAERSPFLTLRASRISPRC